MAENPPYQGLEFPLKDLADLVDTMPSPPGAKENPTAWKPAAVSATVSVGPDSADLRGWITFYDGSKFHFELDKVTKRSGRGAGAAALPYVNVRPNIPPYLGKVGKFKLQGGPGVSILWLSADDIDIVRPALLLYSVAYWMFDLEGTVKYSEKSAAAQEVGS